MGSRNKEPVQQCRLALGAFKPLGHHGHLDFPSGTLRVATHLAGFLLSFIGDGKLEGTRILKAETVRKMRKVPFPKADSKQGLVWYFDKIGGAKTMVHDGGDSGGLDDHAIPIQGRRRLYHPDEREPKNGKFEQALGQRLMRFADCN